MMRRGAELDRDGTIQNILSHPLGKNQKSGASQPRLPVCRQHSGLTADELSAIPDVTGDVNPSETSLTLAARCPLLST